jgi:WD40 repeat protein
VKDLLSYGRFNFLSDGRFMGVRSDPGDKLRVVDFPSGRIVYPEILVGAARVTGVAHGDFALLRPVKDSPLGVVDLKQNKIFFESKRTAFDIWDTVGIGERENGDLIAVDLTNAKTLEAAKLPEAQLGLVCAAAVSPDLDWLAASQNSRGAVWNVQTGQRAYHVRGFRGAYFSPDSNLYTDFPKYLKTDRTIARLLLTRTEVQPLYTLDDKERSFQGGKYLLTLVPTEAGKNANRDITLEVHDLVSRNVLWSRHFPEERPGNFVDFATNSLVLDWMAGSKEIQSLVKQDRDAETKLAPYKNREGIHYIEALDLDSGKQRFAMAIDTGKGSFRISDMIATPDRLVVADTNNRLLVFSSNGTLIGTVTGSHPTVSLPANLMTARTQTGELTLYDLQTLHPRAVHNFDSRVAYSAFSADGKRLLVLSANQTIYLLDTAANEGSTTTAANDP